MEEDGDFDFREISLMTEKPVIHHAEDPEDGADFYVLDVIDTDGNPASVALTIEAMQGLAADAYELSADLESQN
tara:strand:+ start:11553 stop:11774 length:222 start_codon:yes stop_codon:yes gene_type:complete